MGKVREVVAYEHYFENFLKEQPRKVQDKIFKIIEAIETLERVPANYLKAMEGTEGLYEARIQLSSNIWRVFCFFDKGKLVVLLNGFTKKTQKTPTNEIKKAMSLMKEYYEQKKNKMKTKNWKQIKDSVYGKKGTKRRDELDREFESLKIGLLLRKAREEKHLTQDQLAELVDKKRTFISRVENNGSNLTLKTLFDIVEKGLGGKVKISIEM